MQRGITAWEISSKFFLISRVIVVIIPTMIENVANINRQYFNKYKLEIAKQIGNKIKGIAKRNTLINIL